MDYYGKYKFIKVRFGDLVKNPHNPKNALKSEERAALVSSYKKHGGGRPFWICNSPTEEGKYVVLDGNSQVDIYSEVVLKQYLKENPEVKNREDVVVGAILIDTKITTDKELQIITTEFISVAKKINHTALLGLYKSNQDSFTEEFGKIFRINSSTFQTPAFNFNKSAPAPTMSITFKIDDPETQERIKELKSRLGSKIRSNSKVMKMLELGYDISEEDVFKYALDIYWKIYRIDIEKLLEKKKIKN